MSLSKISFTHLLTKPHEIVIQSKVEFNYNEDIFDDENNDSNDEQG